MIRKLLLTLGCVVAASSAAAQFNVPLSGTDRDSHCRVALQTVRSYLAYARAHDVRNEQCLGAWRWPNGVDWFAIITLDGTSKQGVPVERALVVVELTWDGKGMWNAAALGNSGGDLLIGQFRLQR